ncbi:hypothetical protein T492DRAFT_840338 [Pavlovales sp. CCMP2436]|nr:hypothetical protein T492DRAFT_840338 [Pavlovales sp. CCMP2436]
MSPAEMDEETLERDDKSDPDVVMGTEREDVGIGAGSDELAESAELLHAIAKQAFINLAAPLVHVSNGKLTCGASAGQAAADDEVIAATGAYFMRSVRLTTTQLGADNGVSTTVFGPCLSLVSFTGRADEYVPDAEVQSETILACERRGLALSHRPTCWGQERGRSDVHPFMGLGEELVPDKLVKRLSGEVPVGMIAAMDEVNAFPLDCDFPVERGVAICAAPTGCILSAWPAEIDRAAVVIAYWAKY